MLWIGKDETRVDVTGSPKDSTCSSTFAAQGHALVLEARSIPDGREDQIRHRQ
jgi:hypothetical protein